MILFERKWIDFKITELFDVKIGKSIDGNKINDNLGEIPYVTRRVTNNGYDNFVDGFPEEYLFSEVPVITIGNETAKPFVQKEPFYTGTKVNILIPKFKYKSFEILLFMAVSLEHAAKKYTYAYTINSARLKNEVIKLPITVDGKLDWDFMRSFILELENKTKFSSIKTIKKEKIDVTTKKWNEFKITDLFKLKKGKRLKSENRLSGEVEYYSASEYNNGLTDLIANPLFLEEYALIYTTFGDCFFIESKFTASDEITILKNENLNRYNALFIITIINKSKYKFGFGRKAFFNKFENEKIILPINEVGDPDWKYMENYIKSLPYSEFL